MLKTFKVVFLWQGERHVALKIYTSKIEASVAVHELRSKGLQSWFEPANGGSNVLSSRG